MAYLGNSPAAGENNSFKILDDISSYTLTFDGSSASFVSLGDDTIYKYNHRFITGQRVTYSTTGTAIGGLTSGTAYYIIKSDQNTVKLATSLSNANNNNAINFTSLGTGSTHTLNVAFDGINTKFKATYDDGTKAAISRAAQLTLSINGVIQQPNDTTTPTNGFGFDLDSVIIFSTPPVNTDVFWGNLVANNFATFDISDFTIDNFTGNGSQTQFNLSKDPINNDNVLVTIDGVVQYPSDEFNSRSYSVAGNVLIFTAAPGNGTVIQVRHLGFAGANTSNVTGFYGRTGNVTLTSADDIVVDSITATSATISGNVSIAGTITYEDTTNVDSIGVVTARSGVRVGTAASTGTANQTLQVTGGAYVSGNLGIGTTNPTYALEVVGGIAKIGLANTSVLIAGDSGRSIEVGAGTSNLGCYIDLHGADDTYADYAARLIRQSGANAQLILQNRGTGPIQITAQDAGNIQFLTNNAERVRITSIGSVGIGTTNPQALLQVGAATTQSIIVTTDGILGVGGTNTGTATNKLQILTGGVASEGLGIYGTWTSQGAEQGAVNFYGANSANGALANIVCVDNRATAVATRSGSLVFKTSNTSGSLTEALRIDSSGRLLVGITSDTNGGRGQFESSDSLQLSIRRNVAGVGGPTFTMAHSRGSASGAYTALINGDDCGGINYYGADGTADILAASIRVAVDGAVGVSSMPGRIVFSTTAAGASSPTERMRITNSGYSKFTDSGTFQSTTTTRHEFCQSAQSAINLLLHTSNGSYNSEALTINASRAATSLYSFAHLWSGGFTDIEFNLRGDGTGLCDGSWTGGGADYAEYFEWSDDNPDAEDRRGISVVLDGEKIRPAEDGEDPIGVISGNPSVVGDSAWNKWSGKYLRDDFGTYIQEDYEVTDEDGNTVIQQRRKLNPAYDPDQEYTSREERPEWDCVGLMGKLRVRKGQPTGNRWIKMRDISDSVEEWLVR